MKTKSINKMKNTTLKMMMIAITGLFLASLNNVAHAEKKFYDAVNQCVSWDKDAINNRLIKNNCGFEISVWYCSKKSTDDCGKNNINNLYFASGHQIEPYGTDSTGISIKDGVRYFACGADGLSYTGWAIGGNTSNSNRFSCVKIH